MKPLGALRLFATALVVGGAVAHAQPVQVETGHLRVPVPGKPFGIAFSRDGATLFVALDAAAAGGKGTLAMFALQDGVPVLRRRVLLAAGAGGIAVSHDGRLLAVAQQDAGVGVYDVSQLLADGPADPHVATISTGPGPDPRRGSGTLGVGFSNDDALLLATDEWQARVSVIVAATAAGCEAVRIVLDGALAYVTARGDDAVLVLDRAKFASGLHALAAAPNAARVGRIAVGAQPVGLAIAGRLLIVAESHRRSGGSSSAMAVIERASGRLLATLPAADFVREVAVSPDGRLAVAGAFQGQALEVLDLERLVLPPQGP